jgi:hypothetical protein
VDVIRVKSGWPPVVFVPVLCILAVFKIALIVRAISERGASPDRITP